jgi:hypothetical protein
MVWRATRSLSSNASMETRIRMASVSQPTDSTKMPSGPVVAMSTAASVLANDTGDRIEDCSRSPFAIVLGPAAPQRRILLPAVS